MVDEVEGALGTHTLVSMAESGLIMGLETIGQVAGHMTSHHYAYFITERIGEQMQAFNAMVDGHENDSVMKYITEARAKELQREIDEFFQLRSDMNEGQEIKFGADSSSFKGSMDEMRVSLGEEVVVLKPKAKKESWWKRLFRGLAP